MEIKPITTHRAYERALERLDEIFEAAPNTKEGKEAELLAILIEKYEDSKYPIEAPDPIEAIKIRMEEMQLKQKDLIGIIGGKSRVSEVLNRKKKLTVEMIRELEQELNISASTLIRDYELKK